MQRRRTVNTAIFSRTRVCLCVCVCAPHCTHLRAWVTGTRVTVTRTQLMNIHAVIFFLHYSHQRKNSQNTPAFSIHRLAIFFFFSKPTLADTFGYTGKYGKTKRKMGAEAERQTGSRANFHFCCSQLVREAVSESDNGERKCSPVGWPWLQNTHSHTTVNSAVITEVAFFSVWLFVSCVRACHPVFISVSLSVCLPLFYRCAQNVRGKHQCKSSF